MTTRSARSLLAVGALLVGGTLTGCGGDDTSAASPPSSTPSASSSTGTSPSPADDSPSGPTLAVTVDGDSITPTNKSLQLSTGDTLTLVVTSDRSGELHVHSSPEQELEFDAGTTELPITLDQPGQVDIEEHASDSLIARVLVK